MRAGGQADESQAQCQLPEAQHWEFLLHLLSAPSALSLPDSSSQRLWGWRECGLEGWQLRGWQADEGRAGVRVDKALCHLPLGKKDQKLELLQEGASPGNSE